MPNKPPKKRVNEKKGIVTITRTTPLKEVLKVEYQCRQCGHCCRFGAGYMVKEDLKRVATFLKSDENTIKKQYFDEVTQFNTTLLRPKLLKDQRMPFGRCIFLKGNICSIHEAKPLNCRVANYGEQGDEINEWFFLNYFVQSDDPQSLREWAEHVRSRGGKTIPGGTLKEIVGEKRAKEIIKYKDMIYDEKKIIRTLMSTQKKVAKKKKTVKRKSSVKKTQKKTVNKTKKK